MSADSDSPTAPQDPEGATRTISLSNATPGETIIGPYRLLRQIGEGGMGVVYHAQQTQPIRRDVALKIIKPGMDSKQVIARFESERQSLALMDHPAIARVFDAGTTPAGLPYFVMELVNGVPISRYCDSKRLPLRERIELFLSVCKAIQHAHQKGIIHRDIKPSNILVTELDGKPQVKVIDFGLAKALGQQLSDATIMTNLGTVVGTLEYMSPEQAELSRQDIDTRSDVYSLGVVLYELMTGTTPLDQQLTKAVYLEALRRIREEEPVTPSVRTRRSATSAEAAGQRRTDAAHLPKLLDGELDWITMKALEKERARRYETVNGLARDLERFLKGEPVEAAPPSVVYRVGKFARRHRVWLAAAATAVTAICVGAGVAVYQARIAQQRFEMVRGLAHSFVFDYDDDLAKVQGNTAVREKMVVKALEYLDALAKGARNDLDLQQELAAAYRKVGDAQGNPARQNLGQPDAAMASYRKAAAIYERLGSKYAAQVAEFYAAFTALLANTGNWREAGPIGEKALHAAEQLAQAKPDDEIAQLGPPRAMSLLGDVDDFNGKEADSITKYRKADEMVRPVLARWHDLSSLKVAESTRSRMTQALRLSGQLEEGNRACEDDEKLLQELMQLAPSNPQFRGSYVSHLHDWSRNYYDDIGPSLEDPGSSLKILRQAVDLSREDVAKDPRDVAAKLTLAVSLFQVSFPLRLSEPRGAVQAAEESVGLFDHQIAAGNNNPFVLSRRGGALRRLVEALLAAGRTQDSRAQATKLVDAERSIAQQEEPELKVSNYLGLSLIDQALTAEALSDRPAALAALTEAEQVLTKLDTRDPQDLTSVVPLARARELLSEYWRKAGDEAQSRHWLDEAVRLWHEFHDQNDYVRRQTAKLTDGKR